MDPLSLSRGRKSCKNACIMTISQLYYGLMSSEASQFMSCPKRFNVRDQLWMNSLLTQKSHFLYSLLPPSFARRSAENTFIPFLTELSRTEGWYKLQTWCAAHPTRSSVEPCKGSKQGKAKINQQNKIFSF